MSQGSVRETDGRHQFVGTRRLSSLNQCWTTTMLGGAAAVSELSCGFGAIPVKQSNMRPPLSRMP